METSAAAQIEVFEAGVRGDLAARTGAANDGGALAQGGGEGYAGIRDGFAGGDDAKLGEAVEMILAAAFEVRAGIVAADFRGDLKTEL